MFHKYPEVFPSGYFRFLKTNLNESYVKGTYIYRDGVLLTYKRYKKKTSMACKGDYLLDKMISINPGNGKAQEVIEEFLGTIGGFHRCFVKVSKDNTRAIQFYQRNGFGIYEGGTSTSNSILTALCIKMVLN